MTNVYATLDIATMTVVTTLDRDVAIAHAEKNDLICADGPDGLAELTGPQMVAFYNATAAEIDVGLTPVNRFATKDAGMKRLWANILDLHERRQNRITVEAPTEKQVLETLENKAAIQEQIADKARDALAPAKETDYPAPTSVRRHVPKELEPTAAPNDFPKVPASTMKRGGGISLAPKKKAYPCREGSKQSIMVDMLSRPQGATMRELLSALSGGKKPWQEVTIKSGLNWDMNKIKGYGIKTRDRLGEVCYHLVLPAGLDRPLPHIPRTKEKTK